jgi:hypothetical protein
LSRSNDRPARRRLLSAGIGLAAAGAAFRPPAAHAAAPRAEPFDAETWARLKASLPRPAVVVFTTTYCTTCPEVFEALHAEIRTRRPGAPLVAVVMDGEALGRRPRESHLAHASRLFVFRGQEAALRHAVDPGWRGVTPWVALLGAEGEPSFGGGTPSRERLDAWSGRVSPR